MASNSHGSSLLNLQLDPVGVDIIVLSSDEDELYDNVRKAPKLIELTDSDDETKRDSADEESIQESVIKMEVVSNQGERDEFEDNE